MDTMYLCVCAHVCVFVHVATQIALFCWKLCVFFFKKGYESHFLKNHMELFVDSEYCMSTKNVV